MLVSSSRAAEESYDQISFIGAKTISSFSILTMSSYFPFEGVFKQHIDHEKLRDIDVNFTKRDFERQDLQLYFDQTILQTTARIPLGEHYRGEYITCMVLNGLDVMISYFFS